MGEAFIAFTQATRAAKHGRSAIAAAFRRLKASGFIVLVREGTRPNAPGAAAGQRQATVWDLPTRYAHARPMPLLPHGVDRPRGKVRLNVHRIRADVRELSPAATKVLAFAVARQHRDKHGGLVETAPFPLPARQLARALRLSASGVAEAVGELAAMGRLLLAKPQSGRRPATYKLRGHYTRHEKHGGRVPALPEPMVTTGGPGSGRKRPETAAASVPVVDANL